MKGILYKARHACKSCTAGGLVTVVANNDDLDTVNAALLEKVNKFCYLVDVQSGCDEYLAILSGKSSLIPNGTSCIRSWLIYDNDIGL